MARRENGTFIDAEGIQALQRWKNTVKREIFFADKSAQTLREMVEMRQKQLEKARLLARRMGL